MTAKRKTLSCKRLCYACDSDQTYRDNRGRYHWYGNPPIGFLCENCNNNIIKNPVWHARINQNRMQFKNLSLYLKINPRIGVCNWCRAILGQINTQTNKLCKSMQMNHWSYHDEDPLKDALELCAPCHKKYHRELKKEKEEPKPI